MIHSEPKRHKLSDERYGKVKKIYIGPQKMLVRPATYESGVLGEFFVTMDKTGDTTRGLLDAVATAVSIGLQYGIPLEVFSSKFEHTKFEPSGQVRPGEGEEPHFASSPLDAMFRYLRERFGSESWTVAPSSLIVKDGRILLAKRPEGKAQGGLWETPGGKCEPGESELDALRREIIEELGVDCKVKNKLVDVFLAPPRVNRRLRIPFYFVELAEGVEPKALASSEVRWFEPFELPGLPMTPATTDVLGSEEMLRKVFPVEKEGI